MDFYKVFLDDMEVVQGRMAMSVLLWILDYPGFSSCMYIVFTSWQHQSPQKHELLVLVTAWP